MRVIAEEGQEVALVFRVQPFLVLPNEQKRCMEIILNQFRGFYRGRIPEAEGDGIILDVMADGGARTMRWRVADAEVLMSAEIGKIGVVTPTLVKV